MKPIFSVTFTIDGEHWQVPFRQLEWAESYAKQVARNYPDGEATNILVNDLST